MKLAFQNEQEFNQKFNSFATTPERKFLLKLIYTALTHEKGNTELRELCVYFAKNLKDRKYLKQHNILILQDLLGKLILINTNNYYQDDENFKKTCQTLNKLLNYMTLESKKPENKNVDPYELLKRGYNSNLNGAVEVEYPIVKRIKKLKDFKRVGVKQRGVMAGGIYEDANKNRWVIKEGHYANLRGHPTAIEFIAGKLYQILLREGAAKTILVYDELNHKVMIGSKMIPNVKTLFDFNTSNNNFKYDYYNNRYLQVDFNKLYNGSKVRNYADTVVSIGFLLDMDKHAENLLVQDVGNGQVICVIDHGLAFNSDTSLTLAKLHEYLKEKQVTLDGINMISYQELHDAMARIANVSVDELKAATVRKIQTAELYLRTSGDHRSLEATRNNLFEVLDSSKEDTQEMLFELELDNALHTGNRHELERLKQQKNGCLPRTITPYYDVGAHYETYRTPCTLKKLADKYQHPELKAHL